jgi:polar amino acid transport system substrate-binding protein
MGSNQRLKLLLNLACGFLTLLLMVNPVHAQKSTESLQVATRIVPPFVFEQEGQLAGFSIDLWRSIAEQLNMKSEFAVKSTVADLLAATKTGKADMGISAISITAEREQDFDFSQPVFDSGLQILVPSDAVSGSPSLWTVIASPALLQLVGGFLLIVLIPAHLVYFSERGRKEGMLVSRSYFPGIFEACWWAASTLATQADAMPRSALGRVVAILWMFTSVIFVALFTATVTTALTVQQLQGNIQGPQDLPGKRVATIASSTSATFLQKQNIQTLEFPRIEQAYEALAKGRADAVVFDAPVLLYYSAHSGKGKAQVVGPVFREENYGIVFPSNSPYRELVNKALLTLKENGTYQRLYDKWFTVQK